MMQSVQRSVFPLLLSNILFFPVIVFAQPKAFNVTAISALNNASRLECWQLEAAGVPARGAINFDLGNFTNGLVSIIPAFTTSGTISNAVTKQYSLIMSGLVHIKTPHSGLPPDQSEIWIQGGKYGWLIAADLKDEAASGHVTEFPSAADTVIAQFPFVGNKAPGHEVLYAGPCRMEEMIGL